MPTNAAPPRMVMSSQKRIFLGSPSWIAAYALTIDTLEQISRNVLKAEILMLSTIPSLAHSPAAPNRRMTYVPNRAAKNMTSEARNTHNPSGLVYWGRKSSVAWGELYSYGPRYTVGTFSQLPCGAGDGSDHSSPLSFHGFCGAGFPFLRLHQKFTKKMSCVVNSRNALIEMNTFIGW